MLCESPRERGPSSRRRQRSSSIGRAGQSAVVKAMRITGTIARSAPKAKAKAKASPMKRPAASSS
eukprot:7141055-Pyramimonas_sp.AAC.1